MEIRDNQVESQGREDRRGNQGGEKLLVKQTHMDRLCSDTDTSDSTDTDRILIFLPHSPPNKTVVH